MKSLYKALIVGLLILPTIAFATPVSWDFAGNVLQPLQSAWGAVVKGSYFTATSSIPSQFPFATSTSFTATRIHNSVLQAISSAGLLFKSNNGTDIADFGAGGSSNATFYGGVNIDGQTRLATSLSGSLYANSGVVGATATGSLTENVTGLEFDQTRGLLGGSAALSLTSGFSIPLTASTSNWNTFYDTPSTRITAGTNLSWSGNTLNATGGSGTDVNWAYTNGNTFISPATTTNGIIVRASSTIGDGTGTGGLTVNGGVTTTSSFNFGNNFNTLVASLTSGSFINASSSGRSGLMMHNTGTGTAPEYRFVVGDAYDTSNYVAFGLTNRGATSGGTLRLTQKTDTAYTLAQARNLLIASSDFGSVSGTDLYLAAGSPLLPPMVVLDGPTQRMGIGIATSSTPTSLLTVNGDISTANIYATGTASSTNASTTNMSIYGRLFDRTSSAGTNGMVLQTNGSGVQWVATSSLGLGGAGGGTVTSVDMTVPTGFSISGNPVTTNGTLALTYDAGYSGFLTASGTNWNSFYETPSSRITSGSNLSWSGNTLNVTGLISTTTDLTNTYALYATAANTVADMQSSSDAVRWMTGTGNTLLVGTSSASSAKLEVRNQDGTSTRGLLRLISNSSSGADYDIRIDSPDADIEFCDQVTRPAGCFEINSVMANNQLYFTPRAGSDSGFLYPAMTIHRDPSTGWGSVGIGTQYDTPGGTLELAGSTTVSNIMAVTDVRGGTDGNVLMIKQSTGFIGMGSTSPSRRLTVAGDGLFANTYATGTASSTNASTTVLSLFGRLFDRTQSAGTNGMVLQTTGSGVTWVATSTLGLGGAGGGTVTSVDMTVPTGFTISGNPVTTSGTLGLGFTAGYSLASTSDFQRINQAIASTTALNATSPLTYTGTTGNLSIQTANGSQSGALSSSDWALFNQKVSSTSIDTSAELGNLLTDETGSGNVVFSASPTLTGLLTVPSINVTASSTLGFASSTALSVSGNTFLGSLTGVLKGTSGLVSAAVNGTDYTLISGTTCSGTDKVSAISAAGVVTCSSDQLGGGGSGSISTSTELADTYVTYATGVNTIGTMFNTPHDALRWVSDGTYRTLLVGTSSASNAKLEIRNTDTTQTRGNVRIISESSSGGDYDIRLDSPDADIEFCDASSQPGGCFEINSVMANNQLYFTPRNSGNTGFLYPALTIHRDSTTGWGSLGVGTQFDTPGASIEIAGSSTLSNIFALTDIRGGTDGNRMIVKQATGFVGIGETSPNVMLHIATSSGSATHNFVTLKNTGAFAEGGAGMLFQNSAGTIDMARFYARPGTSYTDPSFRIQVADSGKVLRDRLVIDASGMASTTALRTASSTIDNATTTNLAVSGQFNLLGTIITNVATWFSTQLNAVTAFVATAASTWDFGGAASVEIPNGTAPTVDAAGEIAFDTTDEQLIVGASANVVPTQNVKIWTTTIASTSPAFVTAGLLKVPTMLDGYTMTAIRCSVQGGTSKIIAIEDESTNSTEDITCATSVTSDDGTITNASVTAAEEMYIDFGATSGTVDYVSISVFGDWSRE